MMGLAKRSTTLTSFTGHAYRCAIVVPVSLERLIVEGSPFVQGLAVVGVLEGIQNIWSNNKTDPEAFFPYLGLEGRNAWKELNRAW